MKILYVVILYRHYFFPRRVYITIKPVFFSTRATRSVVEKESRSVKPANSEILLCSSSWFNGTLLSSAGFISATCYQDCSYSAEG